jgi:hypothetical protein
MSKAVKYTVVGGAIGATFDLIFAFIYYGQMGATPIRILQSVASGWLGANAREGGMPAAALGALSHYFIAICAAFIFYFVAKKVAWLIKHPVVSGGVFGIGMHLTMNFVVLPLSAYPRAVSFTTQSFIITVLVHMILVGQPIAWMVSKALRSKQ